MLKGQLLSLMANAEKLYHMISEEDQFEDWVQAKITMAEDYINSAYSYLTYYNGDGEADESDWDDNEEWEESDEEWEGDEEDWDDVDEEDFEDDGMDVDIPDYDEALDPDVDDDAIFENKKR
jgi:hypothetical protein